MLRLMVTAIPLLLVALVGCRGEPTAAAVSADDSEVRVAMKPFAPTWTPEPYPRPRLTARPSRTPDPTMMAQTCWERGAEIVRMFAAHDDQNPYAEGPFEVVACADVYPHDLEPEVAAWVVEGHGFPDVAVVMSGTFRDNHSEDRTYSCRLHITNRDDVGSYAAMMSDDCTALVEWLDRHVSTPPTYGGHVPPTPSVDTSFTPPVYPTMSQDEIAEMNKRIKPPPRPGAGMHTATPLPGPHPPPPPTPPWL